MSLSVEVGLIHADEFSDVLSRISRGDQNDDGASIALLCSLTDGGAHAVKLKSGNNVEIKDGRLFVC